MNGPIMLLNSACHPSCQYWQADSGRLYTLDSDVSFAFFMNLLKIATRSM